MRGELNEGYDMKELAWESRGKLKEVGAESEGD